VENQEKNIAVVPADEAGDRRSSRLIVGTPSLESFAGWGPKMEGSLRNILRGLN
jgi:hypothetical protein